MLADLVAQSARGRDVLIVVVRAVRSVGKSLMTTSKSLDLRAKRKGEVKKTLTDAGITHFPSTAAAVGWLASQSSSQA